MDSYILGVSLSGQVLRIASFRKNRTGFVLSSLSRLPLPLITPETTRDAFARWAKIHLPAKVDVSLVGTLSESSMFLKDMEVPPGSPNEVTEAIRWELLTKSATFPKDAVLEWKYQTEPGLGATRVVAMALPESEAQRSYNLLKTTGWFVRALEGSIESLHRGFKTPEEPWMLVSVAGNDATITISRGGVPLFSTLTELSQSDSIVLSGKLTLEAVSTILAKIKQVQKYWFGRSDTSIKRIFLVGDAAHSYLLKRKIKHVLRVTTEFPTPRQLPRVSFGDTKEVELAEFSVATGAALRLSSLRFENGTNFLPSSVLGSVKKDTRVRQLTEAAWTFTRLNVFVSALCLILLSGFMLYSQNLEQTIVQNKRFITNHPGQKMIAEVNRTNELMDASSKLAANQEDIGDKLGFFALNTPPTVSFSAVKFDRTKQSVWTIEGVSDRASILAFYYRLKDQAKGATVTMPYSSLQREKDSAFKVSILW